MSDYIKKVHIGDIDNLSKTSSNQTNQMNSLDNRVEDFNFDSFYIEDTNPENEKKLSGKYVDESGKSHDANYFYSSDGTYNVNYQDGNKDITIKMDIDGSKLNLEVNYIDQNNKIVREVTKYSPNGNIEKSIYKDHNSTSEQAEPLF